MDSSIPVCYFPSTVMFIDDREFFLTGLALNLPRDLSYLMYTAPQEALKLCQKKERILSLDKILSGLGPHQSIDFNDLDSHGVVDMNISQLHQLMYQPDRFGEVSVVIVDYAMPEFNGLDFCRALKDYPVKKLMITGEATNSLAIEAFNEGVIDQFIRKHDKNFKESLHEKIAELQRSYFEDFSQPIRANLAAQPQCALKEDFFAPLFHQVVQRYNICEYYLLDQRGSYLMIDPRGQLRALIIADDDYIRGYEDIAEDYDAPKAIQKALKNREKIPFFLTDPDRTVSVDEWDHYFHPATQVDAQGKTFYYTVIDDFSRYAPLKTYSSYQSFLDRVM